MTTSVTSKRMSLIAGLAGAGSLVSFATFNLYQLMSDLVVGAPFVSLALGFTGLALGIIALRCDSPSQRGERLCAWVGVACGCVMIVAWIGIAALMISVIYGQPM